MNFERFKLRRSSYPARKKSEGSLPTLKPPGGKKNVSKSPSLPKRQLSPDSSLSKPRSNTVNTLQLPEESSTQHISHSLEDLDKDDDSGTRENGSGCSDIMDEIDSGATDGTTSDSARTRAAIEIIEDKIKRSMEQIKVEQATKEANVNEYLRAAGEADKAALQRIKQMFEKKNQKSTANLSSLQKKLEKYHKILSDLQQYGAHKQTKDKLKDMGQGLKDVGANIVDGITGFSGGVVGNIKGAKETIVSKPREFAHLIKNKFGSADNINSLRPRHKPHVVKHVVSRSEASEDSHHDEGAKSQGGGTLPARELGGGKSDDNQAHSFKYNSDPEDNSSVTSGSGFGAHSSPQSNSQATSQQILITQAALESLMQQLQETKDKSKMLQETMQQVLEEFENFKKLQSMSQEEVTQVKGQVEEDRFKLEGIEEQMNDIAELNQHEVNNLKQDIESTEAKIEYRLEERTSDIQDLLENCQTRITKMELQQQQQQLISMEMVENVTFRTILTKLINVVLALLAVILVFVSTTANLLAPFLTTRARILSTGILVLGLFMGWNHWPSICDLFLHVYNYVWTLWPFR